MILALEQQLVTLVLAVQFALAGLIDQALETLDEAALAVVVALAVLSAPLARAWAGFPCPDGRPICRACKRAQPSDRTF